MSLLALGINHKTAPVALREKVAFTPDSLATALSSLKKLAGINESVIVSTCNRTEVYINAEHDAAELAPTLKHWLAGFHHVDRALVDDHSYVYEHDAAITHIMRVAAGLDSLILGEPQILGQVKQAFNDARHNGTVGAEFERLFQHTFSVAKKVRTDTDIGANAVSVAFAAVQLAKHIFAELPQRSVLLVGAGETIELVAQHLKEQGVRKISVANRTLARAENLAGRLQAEVITLAQVPEQLHHFDIVISSTASQLPLIGKGMVERSLRQRRNMPMFLVDLAVPRDIESEVNELGDAYLYTVDDLQHIVEQNLATREEAAREAEQIIASQMEQYRSWQQAQQSIDLVRQFRERGTGQRDELVARALAQLQDGKAAEQIIEELAYKLTNSLMHGPTRVLREAAAKREASLTQWLSDSLELDSQSDQRRE